MTEGGCEQCTDLDADDYVYPDNKPITLCATHAKQAGFCISCGWFAAGADDDFISRNNLGICYECWQEMNDEASEGDDQYYAY